LVPVSRLFRNREFYRSKKGGGMASQLVFDDFRMVIEAIADLICCHGQSTDDDGQLRLQLIERGFELDLIRAAEEWCDRAQASGSLMDILGTFAPASSNHRVYSPLERVSVSDEVWSAIEACRIRGVITIDMAERLLESAREIDTRDWDDEDVRAFLLDACIANGLPSNQPKIERALQGDFRTYYC
jgi:Protein of unknown function (DUF494)